MTEILPLHVVEDKLTNILAAVANTFDRTRAEQRSKYARNGTRIFHHVGHQLTNNTFVFLIDFFIFTINTYRFVNVHPRERVQHVVQHLDGMTAQRLQTYQQRLMLLGEFLQRSTADFVRHVANTLQLGNGFTDHHNQSQVARRRLTFGDNAHAGFIDRHFHHVDVLVAFDHALRQIAVLVMHRGDCIRKLLLHHAAHGHHLRADTFQFGVELAGNMFIKIETVHNALLNQP
ncbi:hypothetical protein HmCmsJML163_00963 [Escherichia coli]|nr:hypothetical protein HmCmsJML163_00963 [Escherichia coli]GDQ39918.1 hypothetical protein BvCmsOUNP017_02630 [Escherichia coli]